MKLQVSKWFVIVVAREFSVCDSHRLQEKEKVGRRVRALAKQGSSQHHCAGSPMSLCSYSDITAQ